MAYGNLSADENALMTHWSMWGSAGYPIKKIGKRWTWEFRSIKYPLVVKTRKAAVEHFELYMTCLRDRAAGRV